MGTRTLTALSTGAALLALGACTGAPTPPLEAARAEVQAAQSDPQLVRFAPGELEQARMALQNAEAAYMEGADVDDIDSKAYIASQSVAIARAAADERSTTEQASTLDAERERIRVAALKEQLASMQPKETDRGLIVTIGDVLFDTASSTLRPGGIQQVGRVADALTANPGQTVIVEGHADSRGSESYNMALSQRRADAVRAELVAGGVPPNQIVARGMGEGYPVTTNATAAGQQQNRRVEIVIQGASTASTRPMG
jgi:outer membrane protein OmpA-like peptidoglycan-associated protein